MNTPDADALAQRGAALFQAGRDEPAIAVLRAAVALDPAAPEAWQQLAAALWRQGRRRAALGVLRDAVAADPDDASHWLHLGAGLLADGRWRLARYALAEAGRLAADAATVARAGELAEQLEALPEAQASEQAARAAEPVLGDAGAAADERERAIAALLADHGPWQLVRLLCEPHWPAGLEGLLRELGILALGVLRAELPANTACAPRVLGALGRIAPDAAHEAVEALLDADEPARRAAGSRLVLRLFTRLPDRYELAAHRALGDADPEVREAVAQGLAGCLTTLSARAYPDRLQRLLFAALDDRSHPAWAKALEWLHAAVEVERGAADQLLRRALRHPEPEVVERALDAVVAGGNAELLRQVYGDGDAAVRRAALDGFARLRAVDLLALGLWDEDPALRAGAAARLPDAGDGEATAALRDALAGEQDETARAAMEAALAKLTRPEEAADGNLTAGDASLTETDAAASEETDGEPPFEDEEHGP